MRYFLIAFLVVFTSPALAQSEDQGSSIEVAVATVTAPVESFTSPVLEGNSDIVGQSLEQLIEGSPLHAPIEGLPDIVWREKKCSGCHQWDKAALCTQGKFYVENGLDFLARKQHPYGGSFKANVTLWAENGCE